jgi:hypothetical protein
MWFVQSGLCCFFEDEDIGVKEHIDLLVLNEIEHPCSYLDIKVVDGVLEEMSCSIHESDLRPRICREQQPCILCYPLGVKSISINGAPMNFNDDLNKLFNRHY